MLVCAAGDTHGKIDRLYAEVDAFARCLGRAFSLVLHVGDLGVWPSSERVNRVTRRHGGVGDFPAWYAERRRAPVPTIFVAGNHEDFDFLAASDGEILPGLHYLRSGRVVELEGLRVAGVGGCYSRKDFRRGHGASPRHYTASMTRQLLAGGWFDVLLTHDAPAGISVGSKVVEGEGLREIVEHRQPSIVFFGHHHVRASGMIAGVPIVGLALVGRPGWLVAWDTGRGLVAEWCGEVGR